MKMTSHMCPVCGSEYQRERSSKRVCSDACKLRAKHEVRSWRRLIERAEKGAILPADIRYTLNGVQLKAPNGRAMVMVDHDVTLPITTAINAASVRIKAEEEVGNIDSTARWYAIREMLVSERDNAGKRIAKKAGVFCVNTGVEVEKGLEVIGLCADEYDRMMREEYAALVVLVMDKLSAIVALHTGKQPLLF